MFGIALFGVVSYRALPVSDLPNVDPAYNRGMTSITTDTITDQPSTKSPRRMLASFVAGLALASAVAFGVNVAADDNPAPNPVQQGHVQSVGSSADLCRPVDGRC